MTERSVVYGEWGKPGVCITQEFEEFSTFTSGQYVQLATRRAAWIDGQLATLDQACECLAGRAGTVFEQMSIDQVKMKLSPTLLHVQPWHGHEIKCERPGCKNVVYRTDEKPDCRSLFYLKTKAGRMTWYCSGKCWLEHAHGVKKK